MTVSFGMTTPPGSENGGAVNSNGRRVLAAKIDSASNVNNNNNNNNNGNGNGNNGNINNNNNNNTAANNNNNNNINTAANANNNYNNGPAPNGPNAGKVSVLSVRRVLFGPPADRDETRAWLEQQLDAVTAANSESWNFDFDNERPMRDSPADRYSWERVCPKQPQPQQEQQPQPRIDGRDEASAAADPGQEQQDCRLKSSAAAGKQRQSKVTDYMGKTKKRPLGGVNKIADEELAASGNNKRSRRSAATMMAI